MVKSIFLGIKHRSSKYQYHFALSETILLCSLTSGRVATTAEVNTASSLVNRRLHKKVANRNRDLTNLTERNRVSIHEILMGKTSMADAEMGEQSPEYGNGGKKTATNVV